MLIHLMHCVVCREQSYFWIAPSGKPICDRREPTLDVIVRENYVDISPESI